MAYMKLEGRFPFQVLLSRLLGVWWPILLSTTAARVSRHVNHCWKIEPHVKQLGQSLSREYLSPWLFGHTSRSECFHEPESGPQNGGWTTKRIS
jgi:hypothetical protein